VLDEDLGSESLLSGLVVCLLVAQGRGRDEANSPGGTEEVQQLGSRVSKVGAAGVTEQKRAHAREPNTAARPTRRALTVHRRSRTVAARLRRTGQA
jgi:hypothetical protein